MWDRDGGVAVTTYETLAWWEPALSQAPGIACGLTAHGRTPADLEAHFSMLAHGIDFVSFHVADLPNRFVTTVREQLAMPVITWTVREPWAVDVTRSHADQMTFEGFEA